MRILAPVFLLMTGMLVISFGCSREQNSKGALASVCGRCLTLSELDARARNVAVLFGHKSDSTNGLDRLTEAFKRGYASYWVEDTVLAAAAEAAGVEPATNDIARCRRNAFINFRSKKDRGYEDLLKIEGLDRRYWDDQIRAEALRSTMERYWSEQEPTNLPPDYAAGQVRKMEEWNQVMAETNRIQYAKATNVWERLRGGLDFREAAKKYTELDEEREDDGEWAVVDEKFLSDEPKLLAWLKSAKPGEYSAPISADNGVMIARLDEIAEDEGLAVSRIFFRLGRVLTPAPDEEIVAAAKERYAKELFKRKLAELVRSAKPEFQNNENKEMNK